MKKTAKPSVTLRNMSPELVRRVQQRARQRRLSLNKTVINLLEEATCLSTRPGKKRRYRDLDGLAGQWTLKEASLFEKALAEQRSIDEEQWR